MRKEDIQPDMVLEVPKYGTVISQSTDLGVLDYNPAYIYFYALTWPGKAHITVYGLLEKIILGNQKILQEYHQNPGSGWILRNIIGADPEIFLVDRNRQLLPAWIPLKSKTLTPNVYFDGFAAEFTPKPMKCLANFVDEIQKGLKQIYNAAILHDGTLTTQNVFKIPHKILEMLPDEYVELGCEPSYNAYNKPKLLPSGREIEWRSAGGHIHFNTAASSTQEQINQYVKDLDATLGIAGVALADGLDIAVRREFYGTAGEYRMPKYGFEYRVLSNFWLIHPAVTHLTLELARIALSASIRSLFPIQISDDEVQHIINTNDVTLARENITKHRTVFEEFFKEAFRGGLQTWPQTDSKLKICSDVAFRMLMEGVLKFTGLDIIDNWNLGAFQSKPWKMHSETENCNFYSAAQNWSKLA